jgi:hypothetical protein
MGAASSSGNFWQQKKLKKIRRDGVEIGAMGREV